MAKDEFFFGLMLALMFVGLMIVVGIQVNS